MLWPGGQMQIMFLGINNFFLVIQFYNCFFSSYFYMHKRYIVIQFRLQRACSHGSLRAKARLWTP